MASDDASAADAAAARGAALLATEEWGAAADAYTVALSAAPRCVAHLLCRAAARLRSGDAAGALADVDDAAAAEPHCVAAFARAGEAAFTLARYADARQRFARAADLLAAGASGAGGTASSGVAQAAAAAAAATPSAALLSQWLRKCDAELSLAAGGPPVGVSAAPPAPRAPAPAPAAPAPAEAAACGTAKRTPRDWSAVEKEVDDEESGAKLEGDAALNKLFQTIYARADDDTRRAMVKSYTESGGTALSTDWRTVGAAPVPCEPPDSMVARKFGE